MRHHISVSLAPPVWAGHGGWTSGVRIAISTLSTSTDQLLRAIAVVEHRLELLDTKITGIPPPTSLPIPDMKNIEFKSPVSHYDYGLLTTYEPFILHFLYIIISTQ